MMGLLCAREYFDRDTPEEVGARSRISSLWDEVEWSWFTRGGQEVLYWHWSPTHGWAMNHAIRGWNECLITYVLAARLAASRDRARGLPPRFRERPRISQRQILVWHRAAARHAVRRPAVLRALLVLRPRSARARGPVRGLLGAERAPRADQPRPLRRESRPIRRLRRIVLGADRERRSVRVLRPRSRQRQRHDQPDGCARELAVCARRGRSAVLRHFLDAPRQASLARARLRRRFLREPKLVRGHLSGHRSGPDHPHDREPPDGTVVEALHGGAGSASRASPARFLEPRVGSCTDSDGDVSSSGSPASTGTPWPRC